MITPHAGGDSKDIIEGDGGADAITGGTGIDTAVYAGSAAVVSVNLAIGAMSGGDAQGDTLSDIEQVQGSAFADTVTANGNANANANANANTLWGLAGRRARRQREFHPAPSARICVMGLSDLT